MIADSNTLTLQDTSTSKRLERSIEKIESILFEKARYMNKPIIAEDLGAMIFEATLYKYSKQEAYKQRAKELLTNLKQRLHQHNLGSGFHEGFEGILYTIQYLKKCNVIDTNDLTDDLEKHLLKSLHIDFNANYFDTLHGSIGKLLFYIDPEYKDQQRTKTLIDQFLTSLYKNKNEGFNGFFWYDSNESEKGLINLGMAHGISGVLAFLVRLKELKYDHSLLDPLIEGIINSLFSFRNKITTVSGFPDHYAEDINSRNINSRLGWCYGDLGITHTLVYAYSVLKRNDLLQAAIPILEKLILRTISNSGLTHFERYSFFDNGFCHGISGIAYMLQKINNHLESPQINKRVMYWKNQLLHNLETQLSIEGDIYYPWYRQNKEYSYTLDKECMLDGLCGTGLVLLSMNYNKFDWSDMFLLF